MKNKIFSILSVLTAFLFVTSCEKDMPITQNEKFERLVMNAFIDADSTNNALYLNLTGADSALVVKDAHIEVRVNGELKETEVALSRNRYPVKTQFHPGDVVRIDAYTNDNKYHAWIEETVPHSVESVYVDTAHVYKKFYNNSTSGGGSGTGNIWQYKIYFKDNSGDVNYYRLYMKRSIKQKIIYKIPTEWLPKMVYKEDTVIYYRPDYGSDYMCYEDPIMMDGHSISAGGDNDFGDFLPTLQYTENTYGVFNDNRFNGKSCMLTVYDNLLSYPPYKHTVDTEAETEETTISSIDEIFFVQSITESEYYYLKALNLYRSSDYQDNDDLSGPIKFPTNVHGGTGMVGFSSSASKYIRLQGKYN
jgi:hypothetical protein